MEEAQGQMPILGDLGAELIKMRRNPEQFEVSGMVHCRFCGGKGKGAFQLIRAKSDKAAGTWCKTHGWLSFDSVAFPPTERLTASEIEDRRLEQRRKAEFQKRKEARQ